VHRNPPDHRRTRPTQTLNTASEGNGMRSASTRIMAPTPCSPSHSKTSGVTSSTPCPGPRWDAAPFPWPWPRPSSASGRGSAHVFKAAQTIKNELRACRSSARGFPFGGSLLWYGWLEVQRAVLAAKSGAVLPHLGERQRRLLIGAEVRSLGHGGIWAVDRPDIEARSRDHRTLQVITSPSGMGPLLWLPSSRPRQAET
jgi:hypothetical protein